MSENFGSFDPKDFVLGGFLDGREGEVRSAKFDTFDYNGTVDPPAKQLVLEIVRDDGNDRTERYGIGSCTISEDGNFFIGELRKSARAATFFQYLSKSGFPMKKLNEKGAVALEGAVFTWQHIPVKGSDKDYAVPVKYLEGGGGTAAADNSEVTEALSAFILEALKENQGTLKKTALNRVVGPKLSGQTYELQAKTLMLNEEFLSSIKGVNYENGVLSAVPF